MKITCERTLENEELKELEYEANLMLRLDQSKNWVGFGMLYRTTGENEFHFKEWD